MTDGFKGLPIKIVQGLPKGVAFIVGGTGDHRWYGDNDAEAWKASQEDSPRGAAVVTLKEADAEEKRQKGELMEKGRLTGKELAGEIPTDETLVAAATQVFDRIHPTSYKLSELPTMNEVMVGVFVRMYHLMIAKQRDYGPDNITKAGLRGIVTRANDKIERLKTLVGDPDDQIAKVQKVLEELPDDATNDEMATALMQLNTIVIPKAAVKGESIEDTLLDLADYGLIGYMVYMGAWPKPLQD